MLKRRLSNLKMEEGSSVPLFLQDLQILLNEFASIGEKLDDSLVVEQILMALPSSLDGLVNTLTYQKGGLPSVDQLTEMLLQDDHRRNIRTRKNEAKSCW